MRVIYIGHSGFAAELAHCTLLFDYFEGIFAEFSCKRLCHREWLWFKGISF